MIMKNFLTASVPRYVGILLHRRDAFMRLEMAIAALVVIVYLVASGFSRTIVFYSMYAGDLGSFAWVAMSCSIQSSAPVCFSSVSTLPRDARD